MRTETDIRLRLADIRKELGLKTESKYDLHSLDTWRDALLWVLEED